MRMCLTDGSNKVTSWSHLERTDGKDLTQPGCVRGFFMGRLSFKQKINKLLNNFLERGLCPEFLKDSGYNSLELM